MGKSKVAAIFKKGKDAIRRTTIIEKLKKRINATVQQIGDSMMTGGVDSMEKYKYMLGQAHAYQIIIQEISNLLKKMKRSKMTRKRYRHQRKYQKLNLDFKKNTIKKKKKNLTQKD